MRFFEADLRYPQVRWAQKIDQNFFLFFYFFYSSLWNPNAVIHKAIRRLPRSVSRLTLLCMLILDLAYVIDLPSLYCEGRSNWLGWGGAHVKYLRIMPIFTKFFKILKPSSEVNPRLFMVNSTTENTNIKFIKICDSPIPNVQRGPQADICGYLLFLK